MITISPNLTEWIEAIATALAVVVAVIALCYTKREYNETKDTARHKLFSQLNRRYERNDNIQTVVKYLRKKEPIGAEPDMYHL